MTTQTIFTVLSCFSILMLSIVIYILDKKHNLLRDTSTAKVKPFSFSRVQLAFWFLIIFASYVHISFTTGVLPDANATVLLLLGLSAGTNIFGKFADINDKTSERHQNANSEGFFTDILSNNNGISMLRLQSLAFNFGFGCFFLYNSIAQAKLAIIDESNIALLGISSAGYIANKMTENKNITKE